MVRETVTKGVGNEEEEAVAVVEVEVHDTYI